jgi:hypothetical protein
LWPSARRRSQSIRCPLQSCRTPRVLERPQRQRSHREAQQPKADAESTKGPTLIPRYPWARSSSSRSNNFQSFVQSPRRVFTPRESRRGDPSSRQPLFCHPSQTRAVSPSPPDGSRRCCMDSMTWMTRQGARGIHRRCTGDRRGLRQVVVRDGEWHRHRPGRECRWSEDNLRNFSSSFWDGNTDGGGDGTNNCAALY